MPEHIFISYATEDIKIASRICELLEEHGVSCWIAPRDVTPGKDYGEEIVNAIETSLAVVLILSENANKSRFVKSEIERAYSNSKIVFPIRVREVEPSRPLQLFIGAAHWIDAFRPPLEQKIDQLIQAIESLTGKGRMEKFPFIPMKRKRKHVPKIAIAVVAIIAVLVVIAGILWTGRDQPFTSAESSPGEARAVGSRQEPESPAGEAHSTTFSSSWFPERAAPPAAITTNGKRYFVIATLDASIEEYAELRRNGFNTVIICTPNNEATFLNAAQQHGLRVILTPDYDSNVSYERFASHPALLAWRLPDEPNVHNTSMERIKEVYQKANLNGGGHPAWLNIWPKEEGFKFAPHCDVFGADPYVYSPWEMYSKEAIQNLGYPDRIGIVAYATDRCVQTVYGDKPVWIWIQASVLNGHQSTPEQLRSMTFLAVNHGATGIIYYRYGGEIDNSFGLSHARMQQHKNAAFRAAKEIGEMASAILAGKVKNAVSLEQYSNYFDTAAFLDGKSMYIVTVSMTDQSVEVPFRLSMSTGGQIQVLSENRTISIVGRQFRDRFFPYETHIYRLNVI